MQLGRWEKCASAGVSGWTMPSGWYSQRNIIHGPYLMELTACGAAGVILGVGYIFITI